MPQGLQENELLEEDEISSVDRDDVHESKETVLEIKLYSWSTPIVGLVMLAVGLLAGYMGRPLLVQQIASISSVEATPTSQASSASASGQAQETTDTQELMEFLITQTRHFKGDPNAPVVMIEFSDYQ